MKKLIKIYLHSDKTDMCGQGEDEGLEDSAFEEFKYALYEVEFTLEVDTVTGQYEIKTIDCGDGCGLFTR